MSIMTLFGRKFILAADPVPPVLRYGPNIIVLGFEEYRDLLHETTGHRYDSAFAVVEGHDAYLANSIQI